MFSDFSTKGGCDDDRIDMGIYCVRCNDCLYL
jgi:hypothetical protein